MKKVTCNSLTRPRVVVLGGGFGGLAVTQVLASCNVNITLVDRKNHHCFQPLLYQVATAGLSPADVAWPIRSIFANCKNVRVVLEEVTRVDCNRNVVRTMSERSYGFDYLVVATGATHSYFGHPEWSVVAPGLKTIEDAVEIRQRIFTAFEQAELEDDLGGRTRLLTFVIVGGGPTGVELAGAVADAARNTLANDFRSIDPTHARICLIEAGPRLLAGFPPRLSAYTERSLVNRGVEVLKQTAVVGCDSTGVVTTEGLIASATVVWAAGVQASPAGGWLAAECDRAGRILVAPDLSVPGHRNIFAIGDTVSVKTNGKIVPGVAPAAKQMGKYVANVIKARLNGASDPQSFAYRDYGILATIGRKSAVVALQRFNLTGIIAWLFWCVAHIYYLIGTRNRMIVAINWLWEFVTAQRGARIITSQNAAKSTGSSQPLNKAVVSASYGAQGSDLRSNVCVDVQDVPSEWGNPDRLEPQPLLDRR